MDISSVNIIKEELKHKESIVVVKTEYEDMLNLDVKTERDWCVEENQNGNLLATFVKQEPNDNTEGLKEEFCSSEVDKTLYRIKIEELILKNESECDDSKKGIHSEDDTSEIHLYNVCDNHRKSQLTTQISVEHDESLLKIFTCCQCDFKTNRKSSLTNHIRTHKNSIKYSCDQCESKIHKKSDLKIHVMIKHDKNAIKKYGCNHCEYKSHKKAHLETHVLAKHDKNAIKKYSCDHCEYKSHFKNNLKKHVLVKHNNNATKKHSCHYCEYKFHAKGDLKKHLMVKHNKNGIKKYGCEHCEYRSHLKTDIKRHVIVKHDNNAIKKHSCEHCDYRSHRKSNLKRHLVVKHDLKQDIQL